CFVIKIITFKRQGGDNKSILSSYFSNEEITLTDRIGKEKLTYRLFGKQKNALLLYDPSVKVSSVGASKKSRFDMRGIFRGVSEDKIELYFGEQTELDAVADMFQWLDLNDIVVLQADDIIKVRNYLITDLANLSNEHIDPQLENRGEPQRVDVKSLDFSKIAKSLGTQRDETAD
ncbi:MAG: hypothetical protein ACC656_04900, partial [Candidatus Heimdallarchaeota archaeon]